MYKEAIHLIAACLIVTTFVCTTPVSAAIDPATVMGLWLFEDAGAVIDSGPYKYQPTIQGNPTIVEGKFGDALFFDPTASDRVLFSEATEILALNDTLTLAFWIKGLPGNGWPALIGKDRPSGVSWKADSRNEGGRIRIDTSGGSNQVTNLGTILDDQWHHAAWVLDRGDVKGYVDGALVAEDTYVPGDGLATSSGNLYFNGSGSERLPVTFDDIAIFSTALGNDDIAAIYRNGLAGTLLAQEIATDPGPADGAVDVPRDVELSWTPGEFAAAVNGHIVYFSESFKDVNDGAGGITVSANSYVPAQPLDFETTYYWRVDEVNAPPDSTVFPGQVWSFTTEPVSYPIEGANITATASSSGEADFGPEKTIDGSGLDADDLHSTEPTDMWLSGSEPQGAWIQYELDKVYKLHEMWVWNSNQIFEGLFGFGFKDVTVEYSTDGSSWTALAGVPQFVKAPGTAGYAHDTTVDFSGAAAKYVKLTATSNWGGILPQYGLSEVRFFYIPLVAREPSPDSGTIDVAPDVTLAWRAGREAGTHDIYLSTDQQAVIDGTAPAVSVTDASYSTTLDLGSTYYWRVDEVNDAETPTTWQGDIWDFATQESIVVEDFEDYNDYPLYEIYSTWLDGYENPANGSQVGYLTPPIAETTIVHGGGQSMPLIYSNTGGAAYSEAARTFAVAQNWARYGIQTLGLWFYGTPGNTGQLYVKINGVKVAYDGDAGNLAAATWQPWNIDLTTVGVNLASVTSLAIGIDGNAAAGTLYFDDIRLYAYPRQLVTPVQPDPAGLAGHWPLDGNFNDDSGNGRNGTPVGDPTFAPGKIDQAINLDGVDDYVTITGYKGINADRTDPNNPIQRPFSVACWINTTSPDGSLVCWGSSDSTEVGGQYQNFRLNGGRLRAEHGDGRFRGAALLDDGQWHHVAMTVAKGANLWPPATQLYVDGRKDTEGADTNNAQNIWNVTEEADVAIGIRASHVDRFFTGMVDDVYVYERALTQAEIAWLAGKTSPFDEPL